VTTWKQLTPSKEWSVQHDKSEGTTARLFMYEQEVKACL
jgi:hypothetical protein